MKNSCLHLQDVLHTEIPLTKAMNISVAGYDGKELILAAPIRPNINHKCSAFGGSLYSVAVLSGWGLIYLKLMEQQISGHIVIFNSDISYHHPVDRDFQVSCRMPEATDFDRFLDMFHKKGKSRINLQSQIFKDKKIAVTFNGNYVVHT